MPPKQKTEKPEVQKAAAVAIEKALLAADFRDIETLVPYARNAKKHPDEQVANIAGLIEEFGWTNPVLADAQGILAGHGRIMAARKLYAAGRTIKLPNGIEIPHGTVPVIDCSGWSEAKRRFYILADNQSAESSWDMEMLSVEFAELQALDFDLTLAGFTADFVNQVNGKRVHFGDPDADAPEAPGTPVTRPGDIWVMGDHRIICGDACDADTVKAMLAGDTPNLMVTDPPYGVEYDAAWRGKSRNADGSRLSTGEDRAVGVVENDGRADWREAWALFDGDVAFVWCASLKSHIVAESLIASGFDLRFQIIWAKNNFAIGRGDYHWKHEPAWYAVRKGGKANWQGDRKQTMVWEIAKPQKSETGHSTQKPIDCMRIPIENNSKPGDLVYEPFCGSGTLIIACEMTGRLARAIELSPAYVDVAVSRWEAFTKLPAILEGDGRTFAEVMAERLPPGSVTVTAAEKPKPKAKAKPPKPAAAPSA